MRFHLAAPSALQHGATIQKFSGRGWSAPTISISSIAHAGEKERRRVAVNVAGRRRVSASHPIGLDRTFVINANPIPRSIRAALIIRSESSSRRHFGMDYHLRSMLDYHRPN
jgi:hypothetical protein